MNFGRRDYYVWIGFSAAVAALAVWGFLFVYLQMPTGGREILSDWLVGVATKLTALCGIGFLIYVIHRCYPAGQ